jgi:hypothetical protein
MSGEEFSDAKMFKKKFYLFTKLSLKKNDILERRLEV